MGCHTTVKVEYIAWWERMVRKPQAANAGVGIANRRWALAQVHLAVFLFGLAGLFGKLLHWPAAAIVLGRTGFAALALGGGWYGTANPCVRRRDEMGWD